MKHDNRWRKIAREVYERVIDTHGGRAEKDEILDELKDEIRAHGLSDDIFDTVVEDLLKNEDDRQAKKANSGQLDLLTGEDEALDAVWRLGESTRVRARRATRDDVYAWLGLKAKNAADTAAAFAREQGRLSKLTPYMVDGNVTVEDAVRRYRDDNA